MPFRSLKSSAVMEISRPSMTIETRSNARSGSIQLQPTIQVKPEEERHPKSNGFQTTTLSPSTPDRHIPRFSIDGTTLASGSPSRRLSKIELSPQTPSAMPINKPRKLMASIKGWAKGSLQRRRDREDPNSGPSSPLSPDIPSKKDGFMGNNRLSTNGLLSRITRTQSRLATGARQSSKSSATPVSHKRMSASKSPGHSLLSQLPSSTTVSDQKSYDISAPALTPPKVWTGAGTYHEYSGLWDDTDLWMPSGDCVITYCGHDGIAKPIFKVHSAVLSQAGSNLLARFVRAAKQGDHAGSLLGITSSNEPSSLNSTGLLGNDSKPSLDVDRPTRPLDTVVTHILAFATLLPPLETALSSSSLGPGPRDDMSHQRRELAIRNLLALLYGKPLAGTDLCDMLTDLQLVLDCYFMTLAGKSDLDQETVPDPVGPSTSSLTANMLVSHVVDQGLDDVRNNIESAFGMLAWAEQPAVRWGGGFSEAFVHAVGMMDEDSLDQNAFHRLSRRTRCDIESAYVALQLRLLATAEILMTFQVPDFGLFGVSDSKNDPIRSPSSLLSIQAAATRFSALLCKFYSTEFEEWPPANLAYGSDKSLKPYGNPGRWLTRSLALKLQSDFGILFDYLVDRDVGWKSNSSYPPEFVRKNEPKFGSHPNASHTFDGQSLASILARWDDRHGYEHIPLPSPLLPRDDSATYLETPIPTTPTTPIERLRPRKKTSTIFQLRSFMLRPPASDSSVSPSRNTSISSTMPSGSDLVEASTDQLRAGLNLAKASNVHRFGITLPQNRLLDALISHEQSDAADHPDVIASRIGRWMVVYALLQALSTISVDVQGLKFCGGVDYFLCSPLSGETDNEKVKERKDDEMDRSSPSISSLTAGLLAAEQARSYCWNRARQWQTQDVNVTEVLGLGLSDSSQLIDIELNKADQDGDLEHPHCVESTNPCDSSTSITSSVDDHTFSTYRTSQYGSTLDADSSTLGKRTSVASSAFSLAPVITLDTCSHDVGEVFDVDATIIQPPALPSPSISWNHSFLPTPGSNKDPSLFDYEGSRPGSFLLPYPPPDEDAGLLATKGDIPAPDSDSGLKFISEPVCLVSPSECLSPKSTDPTHHRKQPSLTRSISFGSFPNSASLGSPWLNSQKNCFASSISLNHIVDQPVGPRNLFLNVQGPGFMSVPGPASAPLLGSQASQLPTPFFIPGSAYQSAHPSPTICVMHCPSRIPSSLSLAASYQANTSGLPRTSSLLALSQPQTPTHYVGPLMPDTNRDFPPQPLVDDFDEFDGLDELAFDLEQQYQAAGEAVVFSPPHSKRTSAVVNDVDVSNESTGDTQTLSTSSTNPQTPTDDGNGVRRRSSVAVFFAASANVISLSSAPATTNSNRVKDAVMGIEQKHRTKLYQDGSPDVTIGYTHLEADEAGMDADINALATQFSEDESSSHHEISRKMSKASSIWVLGN